MFALDESALLTKNFKFALDENVDVPWHNIIGIVTKVWHRGKSVGFICMFYFGDLACLHTVLFRMFILFASSLHLLP